MHRFLACIFPFLFALPAAGMRTEYIARHDGARIPGAEVCFFRASPDAGYFGQFLRSNDVRCLPADDVIESAPGRWNIFAVHEAGLVSAHPDSQSLSGADPMLRSSYARVELRLFPAATLDFSAVVPLIAPDESIAVHLLNDGLEAFTSLRPLPPGRPTMFVPAGTSVVPLLVRNGLPVAAGAPIRPAYGETARVEPFSRGTAVVAVVRLDANESEMEQLNAIRAAAPRIVLVAESGKELRPIVASRHGAAGHDSLVIFNDVAPGRYTLENRQPTWRMPAVQITVGESTTVMREPLELRPVTAIRVDWSIDPEVYASAGRSCPGAREDQTRAEVRLIACTGESGSDCETLRSEIVPPSPPFSGSIVAGTDAPARIHRAVLVAGEHSIARDLTITPMILNQRIVDFGGDTISGTITLGGAPVEASIALEGGRGGAVSDSLGRYTAIVERDPGRSAVEVVLCAAGESPSWYRFVPEVPLRRGMIFDVDIPETTLGIRVVSALSGEALQGAKVDVRWIEASEDEELWETAQDVKTDGDGRAEVRHVRPDAKYEVCAYAKGHIGSCIRLSPTGDDVTIRLEPYATREGRVVLPQPILGGRLYWIGRDGAVTESAVVRPDGSFAYRFDHTPDGYCVFTHVPEGSLYVFRPAPADLATMVIRLPVTPSLDVTVLLEEGSLLSGNLSVRVAGLPVPGDVFWSHQASNGRRSQLSPSVASTVVRVALTGPVEVLFAPFPYPAGMPLDPFVVPHWAATLPRESVTPGRPVIFRARAGE
jgi:hypothetical protein